MTAEVINLQFGLQTWMISLTILPRQICGYTQMSFIFVVQTNIESLIVHPLNK